MKKHSQLGLFESKGRLYIEPVSKYRSPFQRDRDRIIHSASFRRLKHKTQVFVNTEGDHYRTRITHSIEVAQISRSVAKYLDLNEDLTESLSLAHDLGHTPFGHAGEDALNECMEDYGGFDHNLQTLRIVMFLENKYFKFDGLNLSIETLEGLLKHNGPVEDTDLVDNLLGLKNFKKKINKKNYKIAIYQIIRDSIDIMIKDLFTNTQKNLKDLKIRSFKDITKSNQLLVCFSDKIQNTENEIKSFLRTKMYNNKIVLRKNQKGKIIIKKLFSIIKSKPRKFISKDQLTKDKYRAISDFISGMTDRYAINLYKNFK